MKKSTALDDSDVLQCAGRVVPARALVLNVASGNLLPQSYDRPLHHVPILAGRDWILERPTGNNCPRTIF